LKFLNNGLGEGRRKNYVSIGGGKRLG